MPLVPLEEAQVLHTQPGQTESTIADVFGQEITARINEINTLQKARDLQENQVTSNSTQSHRQQQLITPDTKDFYADARDLGVLNPLAVERELLLGHITPSKGTVDLQLEQGQVLSPLTSKEIVAPSGHPFNKDHKVQVLVNDGAFIQDTTSVSSTVPVAILSGDSGVTKEVVGSLKPEVEQSGLSVANRTIVVADDENQTPFAGTLLQVESDKVLVLDEEHNRLREVLRDIFSRKDAEVATMMLGQDLRKYVEPVLIKLVDSFAGKAEFTYLEAFENMVIREGKLESIRFMRGGQEQRHRDGKQNTVKEFEYPFTFMDPYVWRVLEFNPRNRLEVLQALCNIARVSVVTDSTTTSDYVNFVVEQAVSAESNKVVKKKAVELLGLVGSWNKVQSVLYAPETTYREREALYYAFSQRKLSQEQKEEVFLKMYASNEVRNGFGYELIVEFEAVDEAKLRPEINRALLDLRARNEESYTRFLEIIRGGGKLSELVSLMRDCPYAVTPKLMTEIGIGTAQKLGFEIELNSFLSDRAIAGRARHRIEGCWRGSDLGHDGNRPNKANEFRTGTEELEFGPEYIERSMRVLKSLGLITHGFGTVHFHVPYEASRSEAIADALGYEFGSENDVEAGYKPKTFEIRNMGLPFALNYNVGSILGTNYLDFSVWAAMTVAANALGDKSVAPGDSATEPMDPELYVRSDLSNVQYDIKDPLGYLTLISYLKVVQNPEYLFPIAYAIFNHPTSLRGIDYDNAFSAFTDGKTFSEVLPILTDLVQVDTNREGCLDKIDTIVKYPEFTLEIGQNIVNAFLRAGRDDLVVLFLDRWRSNLQTPALEVLIDKVFIRLDMEKVVRAAVKDWDTSSRTVFNFPNELCALAEGRISNRELIKILLSIKEESPEEDVRIGYLIIHYFDSEWEKSRLSAETYIAFLSAERRVEVLSKYYATFSATSSASEIVVKAERLLAREIAMLPDGAEISKPVARLLKSDRLSLVLGTAFLNWAFSRCNDAELRNKIVNTVLSNGTNTIELVSRHRTQLWDILAANPLEQYVQIVLDYSGLVELTPGEVIILKDVIRKRLISGNSDHIRGSATWYADMLDLETRQDFNVSDVVESVYEISKAAGSLSKAVFFEVFLLRILSRESKEQFVQAFAKKVYAVGDREFFKYALARRPALMVYFRPTLNELIFDGDAVKDRELLLNVSYYLAYGDNELGNEAFEKLRKNAMCVEEMAALCRGFITFSMSKGNYQHYGQILGWINENRLSHPVEVSGLLHSLIVSVAMSPVFWATGDRSDMIEAIIESESSSIERVVQAMSGAGERFPHYKARLAQALDRRLVDSNTPISLDVLKAAITHRFPITRHKAVVDRLLKTKMEPAVALLLYNVVEIGKLPDDVVRNVYSYLMAKVEGGLTDQTSLRIMVHSDTLIVENVERCFRMALDGIEAAKKQYRQPDTESQMLSKIFSDEISSKLTVNDYMSLLQIPNLALAHKSKICTILLEKEPNAAMLKVFATSLDYKLDPMFSLSIVGLLDKFDPEMIYDFISDWLNHPGADVDDTFSLLSELISSEGSNIMGQENRFEKYGYVRVLPEMIAFVERNIESRSGFLPIIINYMIALSRSKPESLPQIREFVSFVFANCRSSQIVNEVAYGICYNSPLGVEYATEVIKIAQSDSGFMRRINWTDFCFNIIRTNPDNTKIVESILPMLKERDVDLIRRFTELIERNRQKSLAVA